MTNKEQLNITIPALKRPTSKALKKERDWIKSIESDSSPTAEVTLNLGTLLEQDEDFINGDEYAKRRQGLPMLGYQHARWLVENQEKFPAFMKLLGEMYIDFPGTIVVDSDGYRYFPYLDRRGKRWYLHWYWTDFSLDRYGRIAVSSNVAVPSEAKTLEPSGTLGNLDPSEIEIVYKGVAYKLTKK